MAEAIQPAVAYTRQPRGLRVAVAAPVLAMLLATLDNLILSTAMPTIVSELGGLDKLTWVVTAYTLATAVATPVWGKLGDMYGRKNIFLVSIVVFLLGSLLAGLSQSMEQLIAFRAVQGLGGGGLMVGAFAIIMDIVPPREGGRYQGVIASVMGVAMVAGPSLGGVITDQLGWRWCFYVNLPIGALAIFFVVTMLDLPKRKAKGRVDYLGAVLLAFALSAVVLGLSWGGARYSWTSTVILGLGGVAVLAVVLFVLVERRVAEPVLPLRIFANRNFSVNTIMGFLLGLAIFVAMTFVPLFMQTAQGASATQSGFLLTPLLGAMMGVNVLAGRVTSRTGRYKFLLIGGGGLLAVGVFLLSRIEVGTSGFTVGAFSAIYGAGMGLLMGTAMLVAQANSDRSDIGVASSTITLSRSIGGSVGLAVAGTMFADEVRRTMLEQGGEAAVSAVNGSTQLDAESLAGLAPAVRSAYEHAVTNGTHLVFTLVTVASVVLFALAWLIKEVPLPGREAPVAEPENARG
jgi:EmrB/QacA subfamily drug resistance transporter